MFQNKFVQRDFRWSWYTELNGKPVQIFTGRTDEIEFKNNNIFNLQSDELYVIARGSRTSSSNAAPESLSWWETNQSQAFSANLQVDPGFVDVANKNFDLQHDSPMIDAGTFLAQTTNSGSNSTAMEVDDAGWFMDGFDLVSGDTIQIEGQTTYAIIQSIDYSINSLTLDRALSWDADQGVSLKYSNSGPDIGAGSFEYFFGPIIGIDDLLIENEVLIIPNPVHSTFHIELGSNDLVEKVLVYNSLGKQVKEAYSNDVNISNLNTGIYFVEIISGNSETTIRKVIKN